jgi:RNA recognition motif-containing protein
LNPNNEKCNKGFAFVEFFNFRSCQKAIKELNQIMYKGRPIVIDFSIAKVRFMTEQIKEG